jgi:predicted nucleic acid-binding protein
MVYLDTSGFLKLLVDEQFSMDARQALRHAELWSSTLLDVEAHRAARRLDISSELVAEHLEAVTLITIADETIATARSIGSDTLRTLDALHLAAALELGEDIEGIVTYDRRLAAAAAELALTVLGPGLPDQWWQQ